MNHDPEATAQRLTHKIIEIVRSSGVEPDTCNFVVRPAQEGYTLSYVPHEVDIRREMGEHLVEVSIAQEEVGEILAYAGYTPPRLIFQKGDSRGYSLWEGLPASVSVEFERLRKFHFGDCDRF